MAVTAIRLYNFMGFVDTGWLELRPLTLLFGKNSSGKSAIIRALLLLQQSLEVPAGYGPLVFAAEGGVNLGTFERMVYGREVEETLDANTKIAREMRFGFRCEVTSGLLNLLDFSPEEWSDTPTIDFSLSYRWQEANRKTELSVVTIEDSESNQGFSQYPFLEILLSAEEGKKQWYSWGTLLEEPLSGDALDLKTEAGFLPTLMPSDKAAGEDKRFAAVFSNIKRVFDDVCCHQVRKFIGGIKYLGPFRPEPRRYYFLEKLPNKDDSRTGFKAILDYLASTEPNLETDATRWLKRLEFGDEISKATFMESIDGIEALYEIRIGQPSLVVSLREVGYGVSQVLPIILYALTAKSDSLTIIEQPEVHLHPAAQADLADLFIESALGLNRGAFLLETHSEHLILRILRRIRETTENRLKKHAWPIAPNNVQVLYVQAATSGTKLYQLPVTDDGDFAVEWPGGFFPERGKELFDDVL